MNKKILFTILLAMLLAPMCMEGKKKVKKEDVPQLLNYPSAELGEFRLHGGEAVIKGRLITQDPQMIEQMNAHFNVIMRDSIFQRIIEPYKGNVLKAVALNFQKETKRIR